MEFNHTGPESPALANQKDRRGEEGRRSGLEEGKGEEEKDKKREMGFPSDDVVVIRQPESAGEPSVITVSCPDKTGLGCDLCRVILFFGLSIVRGGEPQVPPISCTSPPLFLTKKIDFYEVCGFNFEDCSSVSAED